jgi:hypothetical protein
LKTTTAIELAPLSEPAKDPVTLAVPPGLGKVNPPAPERDELKLYSEKLMTLARIFAGVQVALTVRDLKVSTRLQAFDVLDIVVVTLPLVTVGTFDPDVVHPVAFKAIAVDKVLPPLVVSRGENARPPVRWVHVTLPVATVAGLESELQPVAKMATRASGRRKAHFDSLRTDMAPPPWQPLRAPKAFDHDGSGDSDPRASSSIRAVVLDGVLSPEHWSVWVPSEQP